jgi:hypothetical protein
MDSFASTQGYISFGAGPQIEAEDERMVAKIAEKCSFH